MEKIDYLLGEIVKGDEKIMKDKVKFIVSKTMIFAVMVGFIIFFKSMFGEENTLVGVAVITAALMFLERDLTTRKNKYFLELLGLNLLLGVFAHFATTNWLLGIPLNFIAMFIVGYIFTYDVRKHMYVALGLEYVFMLATPIATEKLPLRLLSLAFGVIVIMGLQILANKNRVEKNGMKMVSSLMLITKKILLEENREEQLKLIRAFDNIAIRLKETIYGSKKEFFYIGSNGKSMLDIIIFLRIIIEKSEEKSTVAEGLKEARANINNEKGLKSLLDSEKNSELEGLLKLLIRINSNKNEVFELDVPKEFQRSTIIKRYFNKDSMRFRYAVKIGVGIAFGSFLVSYFDLFQGKWLLFTLFALIQPYSEYGIARAKYRVSGTVLGSIICVIIFTIVESVLARGIIVAFAGYMDNFHRNYREKMTFITVSAVGSSLILGGTFEMIMTRLIFISLGAILGLIINKIVLPYSIEDAKEELLKIYDESTEKIIEEIKEKNKNGSLENLYITAFLIEEKLKEFNIGEDIKERLQKKKNHFVEEYCNFKINIS